MHQTRCPPQSLNSGAHQIITGKVCRTVILRRACSIISAKADAKRNREQPQEQKQSLDPLPRDAELCNLEWNLDVEHDCFDEEDIEEGAAVSASGVATPTTAAVMPPIDKIKSCKDDSSAPLQTGDEINRHDIARRCAAPGNMFVVVRRIYVLLL